MYRNCLQFILYFTAFETCKLAHNTIKFPGMFTIIRRDGHNNFGNNLTEENSWLHIIRIFHECEDGIVKSIPRITIWHYEACRVMTNVDLEGQILLSHPHLNNGSFFLTSMNTTFSISK